MTLSIAIHRVPLTTLSIEGDPSTLDLDCENTGLRNQYSEVSLTFPNTTLLVSIDPSGAVYNNYVVRKLSFASLIEARLCSRAKGSQLCRR
ncbi:hypothetical protein D3C76_1536630 [compost metagenome]